MKKLIVVSVVSLSVIAGLVGFSIPQESQVKHVVSTQSGIIVQPNTDQLFNFVNFSYRK